MNEKFEKYIEGLSPELKEKARECKTKDELMQLAAENGLEIPEDALEAVAGGCFTSKTETWVCNACNSSMREEESGYPRVNAPLTAKCMKECIIQCSNSAPSAIKIMNTAMNICIRK